AERSTANAAEPERRPVGEQPVQFKSEFHAREPAQFDRTESERSHRTAAESVDANLRLLERMINWAGMSRSLLILVSAFPAAMFAQQAVDAPATPVGGYNLVHAVHSLDKTVPCYRDLLGLQLDGSEDPLARKPQPLDAYRSLLMATPGASWRSALFWIPGANFGLGLREFTGVERKAYRLNLQDP